MLRTELENIIDAFDKDGSNIFRAIENDNAKRLKELTDQASVEYFDSWVKKATECQSWKCLIYLFEKNPRWEPFSRATLLACKANQQAFLDTLIKFSSKNNHDISFLPNALFLEEALFGLTTKPLTDPENGYTALHWSVIHDNHTLFIRQQHCNRDYRPANWNQTYYVRDANHRTPLDLALMLNKLLCAQELIAQMSLKRMALDMSSATFKHIIQHDLKTMSDSWKDEDSEKKIKTRLIELIDELDDTTKEKALKMAMDNKTRLGSLLVESYDTNSTSKPDHETRLILAKKSLALLDKKELEAKKKSEISLLSTTTIQRKLYSETEKLPVETPFIPAPAVIAPVYIPHTEIKSFLTTTQFNAVFKDLPDTKVTADTERKQTLHS